METLIVVLLLLIIALIVKRDNGDIREMLQQLLQENRRLSDEVRALRRLQEEKAEPGSTESKSTIPTFKPAPQPEYRKPIPSQYKAPEKPAPQPAPMVGVTPVANDDAATRIGSAEPPEPTKPFFNRFLRENPDLEKFIGENLVNKIGIAILVLGIAFFVKYAIDQDWIGEGGRVAIGFGCGALLTAIAHYLRRSYTAFSAVLAGGGIAVFYSTIAFAFHQYHFFSQSLAFGLLVLVTIFAVALALLYDSLALAIIATVGGFATPFLVSNGSGNYVVLLTYLAILNGGILALAFFKRWSSLNIIAFAFTVLITGGWLLTSLDPKYRVDHVLALGLITILYALFLGMNMAFPVRFGRAFRAFDLSQLLLLTGCYYAAGMLLLSHVQHGHWNGLFTIATGAVNLALAIYCFRRRGTDRNLLYLLIGLTLTFATLAVPVQLQGHAITMFWCAEFVLLYWLFQRSRIRLFQLGSFALIILSGISLAMDWLNAAPTAGRLTVLFNDTTGAATNVVAIAAFAALNALLRRDKPGETVPEGGPQVPYSFLLWLSGTVALLLLYCSALTAVNLYFYNETGVAIPNIYHRVITALFALLTGFILLKNRIRSAAVLQLLLAALALVYYLFSQDAIRAMRVAVGSGTASSMHLAGHGLATLLYGFLLARCALLAARNEIFANQRGSLAWLLSGAIVLFLSLDAGHYFALTGNAPTVKIREAQWVRAALTILWGICSFALMWLGMRYKERTLRIISLTLFGVALLKLFFYDLRNVSEGGKIAAFILLGALLLTVSFMYQKLKKILIDDRPQ